VLATREPFLFRGSDDPAVDNQGRGRIVKHSVDSKHSHPEKRFPGESASKTP
jgi:hypothetical protein